MSTVPLPGLETLPPSPETLPLTAAERLLAELLQGSAVPVNTRRLLNTEDLLYTGCVLIGDAPVRPVKDRLRWKVDAAQVREAAASLRAVRIDWRDLVPVRPEPGRDRHGRRKPAPEPERGTWRGDVLNALEISGFPTPRDAEDDKRALPVGETLADALKWCDWHTIGATRYLDLVVPQAGRWCVPRSYAELLDRWQDQDRAVRRKVRRCSGCGADGPDGTEWRETTATGYVTTCPGCVSAGTRHYAGEFHGLRYSKKLGLDVESYRCALCPRRALYVDHCHDHGYVRGPLCGGCNVRERAGGGAFPDETHTPDWLRYLRRCIGCQEEDALPLVHVQRLGTLLLMEKRRPRHGRCRTRPRVTLPDPFISSGALLAGYPLRVALECHSHQKQWDLPVMLDELLGLVREHVADTVPDLSRAAGG